MRLQFCPTAIAVALTLASVATAAPVSPQTAILAVYNRQNKAAESRNLNVFMSCLTPDFTMKVEDGEAINNAQVRQNMIGLFASATYISGHTTVQSFILRGNKAYVTTKEHDVIVETNPLTHRPVTIVDNEVDSAVWRTAGSAWKQESTRVISQRQFRYPGDHRADAGSK